MNQLHEAVKDQLKKEIPLFKAGDTIELDMRVLEGDKERIQKYRGVVIARKGGGIEETITVRKISSGIGVERIIPLHSPMIAAIHLVRQGKVRRAKLRYLRDRSGKGTRIEEQR